MTGAPAPECPGPLTLFQYANGQLAGQQRDVVAAHILACSICAAKVRSTGDDGRALADALEPRADGPLSLPPDFDDLDNVTTRPVALVDELAAELGAADAQPSTTRRRPTPLAKGKLPLPPGSRRPTPMASRGSSIPIPRPPPPASPPPAPPASRPPPPDPTTSSDGLPAMAAVSDPALPSLGAPAHPPGIPPPLPSGTYPTAESLVEPKVHGSPMASQSMQRPAAGGSKKAIIIVIVALAIVGVGMAGVLFVYPALTAPGGLLASREHRPEPEPAKEENPPPAEEAQKADGGGEEPVVEEGADDAEANPDPTPPPPPPEGEPTPDAPDAVPPPPPPEAEPEGTPDAAPEQEAPEAADGGTADTTPPPDATPPPNPAPPPDATPPAPEHSPAAAEPAVPEIEVEPVASRDPNEARLNAKRGALALRREKFDEADLYFRKALAHEPRNAIALGGLAAMHYKQGHFRAALAFAAKAVNAAPHDPDLRILLGDAYLETKAYADARQQYKKAAALGHRSANARLEFLATKLGN